MGAKQKAADAELELLTLNETLLANGLPLDEWKVEEARFIKAVTSPDAKKAFKTSLYEAQIKQGKFCLSR